jgi:phosphoribosylanthranilate isomerase
VEAGTMSLIIKICGLSTPDTLDAALQAGADMVGFVRFEKSPRHVSLDALKGLADQVGSIAAKVLLTVDADDDALEAAVAALKPDALQLHGRETPERVRALQKRFRMPVIKAIGVGASAQDIAAAKAFEGVADLILFDAAPGRDGADLPGGTGKAFDWSVLQALDIETPWLLAGGLTPDNVAEAVKTTAAAGVDVSSGVESAPGVKDPGKIAAFVAKARAAAKLGA